MKRRLTGVIAIVICCIHLPATAQTVESLVMPGPVVNGHADIQSECTSCHTRFDRDAQMDLCSDCHEEIANDISQKTGFHGRSADVVGIQCSSCHTDHKGRDADIVELNESTFDHLLTNFELLGKHGDAECAGCHVAEEKYREAPGDCASCHLEDDAHDGSLGDDCADCHNSNDWAEATFDHDTTDFPLLGMHLETDCADCHEDLTHQDTPTDCYGCHAADDFHDGRSGNQCDDCHNPSSWTDTSFNHVRDTNFPLEGGHELLACDGCHSEDPFSDELETECVSCHLDDDDHDGHNGVTCETCHTDEIWTDIKFDHNDDTNFLLNGAHEAVTCNDCHIDPIFDTAPLETCVSCHLPDDVHEGTQGENCQDCHTETKWDEAPGFDHDLTGFPLLGEHENVECDNCHETQVFSQTSPDCASCHIDDDTHGDIYTEQCASCHNPVAWDLWMFDHNVQTSFLLDGAHTDVACSDCHRQSLNSMQRIGERCANCHRTDDIHDGEFGVDCGRCHNDRSFKEVRSLQ